MNFVYDESGVVTTDWVVLVAMVVGLGLAVVYSVGSGAMSLADSIAVEIDLEDF